MADVSKSGSRKEPLVASDSTLPIWQFGPNGWSWATGSRFFQALSALTAVQYFVIFICGLVMLTAGGKQGSMPSPTWPLQPAGTKMPLLQLDIAGKCLVKPDLTQKCVPAQCDWATLGQYCSCDNADAELKNWCNATYVQEHVKASSNGGFTIMGLLVALLACGGMAAAFLQLKGVLKVMPAHDEAMPVERAAVIWYWVRPIIDRVLLAVFTFLFCLISIGVAAGGHGALQPLDFTKAHRGCFLNDWVEDPFNGEQCKEVHYYHDFQNAIDAWTKWHAGKAAAGEDAMAFSTIVCLLILAELAIIHFKVQRNATEMPNVAAAAKSADRSGRSDAYAPVV
jgi:hypothetical protein